jgi:hypothetical protein
MSEKKVEKAEGEDLIPELDTMPRIRDEDVDSVIALFDSCLWARLTDTGFWFPTQDRAVTELVGRIIGMTPYLINFECGERPPPRLPHVEADHDIPEGYIRRVDLKIDVGSTIVGISLPTSSARYHLAPYLIFLRGRGLQPHEVVTRITSKKVSNPSSTFNVAIFELADDTNEGPRSSSEQPSSGVPAEWQ